MPTKSVINQLLIGVATDRMNHQNNIAANYLSILQDYVTNATPKTDFSALF